MKTETDTPRTNAAQIQGNIQNQSDKDSQWPWSAIDRGYDFARELERELNAAMQAIRDIYTNEYNSSETYTICERILPKKEHLHQ